MNIRLLVQRLLWFVRLKNEKIKGMAALKRSGMLFEIKDFQ